MRYLTKVAVNGSGTGKWLGVEKNIDDGRNNKIIPSMVYDVTFMRDDNNYHDKHFLLFHFLLMAIWIARV